MTTTRWNVWAIDPVSPTFLTRARIVKSGLTERAAAKRIDAANGNRRYDTHYVALPDGETPPEYSEGDAPAWPENVDTGYRTDRHMS